MKTSTFATLGLDHEKRVLWQSPDADSLFPSLRTGSHLDDIMPGAASQLERETEFHIEAPANGGEYWRVLPSQIPSSEVHWIVVLDKPAYVASWQTIRECHKARVDLTSELHQGVQQVLTALLLRMSAIDTHASPRDLEELRGLVATALDDLRIVTKTVAPAALPLGLGPALSEFSEILARHTPLTLGVGDDDKKRYPRAIEIIAYEAIRMLMTGLARTGLQEASVSIHGSTESLRLVAELYDFTDSLGETEAMLQAQVLSLLGGQMQVDTESSHTTVLIRLPLEVSE